MDRKSNQLETQPKAVTTTMTAHQHLHQVANEEKCSVPQLRCVRVIKETHKTYSPHCVRLHRCTEDTGCCHSPTAVCAPKTTQDVTLPFFVKKINSKRSKTENLTFVNHTECFCMERNKYKTEYMDVDADVIRSCKCPKFFERIIQDDGTCRCDCSSGNTACESLKNGEEHFSITERTNIKKEIYKAPTCKYGTYLKTEGCCPNGNSQFIDQFNFNNAHAMS